MNLNEKYCLVFRLFIEIGDFCERIVMSVLLRFFKRTQEKWNLRTPKTFGKKKLRPRCPLTGRVIKAKEKVSDDIDLFGDADSFIKFITEMVELNRRVSSQLQAMTSTKNAESTCNMKQN